MQFSQKPYNMIYWNLAVNDVQQLHPFWFIYRKQRKPYQKKNYIEAVGILSAYLILLQHCKF